MPAPFCTESTSGFPQGSSGTIASRIRTERSPEIRKTSLDQEGPPAGRDPTPDVFGLTRVLLLFMVGLGVIGILILLILGIRSIPAWP